MKFAACVEGDGRIWKMRPSFFSVLFRGGKIPLPCGVRFTPFQRAAAEVRRAPARSRVFGCESGKLAGDARAQFGTRPRGIADDGFETQVPFIQRGDGGIARLRGAERLTFGLIGRGN